MSYQLYRNTTLGHTLQETIDEFLQDGQITEQIALKVMLAFDKCINNGLSTRVKTRLTFKVISRLPKTPNLRDTNTQAVRFNRFTNHRFLSSNRLVTCKPTDSVITSGRLCWRMSNFVTYKIWSRSTKSKLWRAMARRLVVRIEIRSGPSFGQSWNRSDPSKRNPRTATSRTIRCNQFFNLIYSISAGKCSDDEVSKFGMFFKVFFQNFDFLY